MKYDLKKTCPECPYAPKTSGWIGSHESAIEFHNIAKEDVPFSCHMSPNQCCVGNALYMNKLCKVSRDSEKASFQAKLRLNNDEPINFSSDGSKLIEFHKK